MRAFLKVVIGDGTRNQIVRAASRAVAFISRDVGGQRNCNAHASEKRRFTRGKGL
jgi:hypothetical protein